MPSGNSLSQQPQDPKRQLRKAEVDAIFDDFEAKTNFVGLYDLLYKVDRRTKPHLYEQRAQNI
jgi:hypothetical protein